MMKEKANPKSAAPRKVKGTVLFTVVCVMMVLIVFMMGTLALAATANKRAQTNYQKEQSEYIARTVLDSVIRVINEDTTGTGLKRDMVDGTLPHCTDANCPGLGHPFIAVTLEGQSYHVHLTETGDTKSVYVNDTDGWKDITVYELSVDVGSATTAADTVYTAYLTGDITTVTGSGPSNGGGGGAFVSIGDLHGSNIGTGGYITGGSYVGVGNTVMNQYHIGTSGDVEVDAPLYVNGNLDTTKALTLHYTGGEDLFAVMGEFNPAHDTGIRTAYDGYSLTTSSYKDLPIMYFGKLTLSNKYWIGSDTVPTNVFAGEFAITTNNDATGMGIHGDLYGFDPTKNNVIKPVMNSVTELYKWTSATITNDAGEPQTFGNIFSAGNLELGGNGGHVLDVQGSIRCDKDVTSSASVSVGGDVVVNGTLRLDGPMTITGNLYADTLVVNSDVTLTGGVVNVNNLLGDANINGASAIRYAATPGGTTTETETWYDNLNYTIDLVTAAAQAWEESTYALNYSVDYHEVQRVNGAEVSNTTTPLTGSQQFGYFSWEDLNAKAQGSTDLGKFSNPNHTIVTAASNQFDATKIAANGTVITPTDVKTKFGGKDIYPQDYVISKMPDAVFSEPQAATYQTGYITKADDLDSSIYDSTKTPQYQVPVYKDNKDPAGNNAFASGMLTIQNSCVLSGTMNGGNIYIKPTGDNVTVILDNLTMDQNGGAGKVMLIVDDAYQVTFFVRGTANLGGGLYTTDYLQLFQGKPAALTNDEIKNIRGDFTISQTLTIPQQVDTSDTNYADDPYLPNVIIYGDVGSTLNIPDGAKVAVTAQIRAPEMSYNHRMGKGGAGINYVQPNGATKLYNAGSGDKHDVIGVIGQLIANNIELQSAEGWGLIYVTEADPRCAACKAAGCTACTGSSTCTCVEPTCTCHGGGGGGGGGGGSYADHFNVLYYNLY